MKPKCEKCGSTGAAFGLYLTIDARWNPQTEKWTLEARDDAGGRELDCLACDQRTQEPEDGFGFPYGLEV